METLPSRLKNLRYEKNVMQKEIANFLDISSSAYGFYEQGKRTPTSDVISKLADYFNVSTDYLLGKSNIKSHVSVKKSDDNQSDLPDKFTTAQDAIKYILKQPTLMAYGNCDIESLDEEDLIDFANDLLEQFKLLSYKYKK